MKEKNFKIKFVNSLYSSKCIEESVKEFSGLAEIKIKKNSLCTEVFLTGYENDSIPFELANYALFLTIQSK